MEYYYKVCLPKKKGTQNACDNSANITPVERVTHELKQLQIAFDKKKSEQYEQTNEDLAGKINNVIVALDTVLVEPASCYTLLYLGTPVYLKHVDPQNCEAFNFVLLGHIEDIFGSVGQPMYSVQIAHNSKNLFNIGEEVYYFSNNPNTQLMYVKQKTVDTCNAIKRQKRNLHPKKY